MCSISSLNCCPFFFHFIVLLLDHFSNLSGSVRTATAASNVLSALCDLQMAWVVSVLSFMYLMKVRNRRGCYRNVLPICERNVNNLSLSMFFSISCAFIIESFVQDNISFFGLKECHARQCQKNLLNQIGICYCFQFIYQSDLSKRKEGKI